MTLLPKTLSEKQNDRSLLFAVYAASLGLLSFFYLYGVHLLRLEEPAVYCAVLTVKALFLLTLPFLLKPAASLPLVLLLINAVWVVLTQLLVHGTRPDLYPLLFVLCYAGGAAFRGRQRERLLDLFTLVAGSVLALWAAAGLAVVLCGHPLTLLPGLLGNIRVAVEYQATGVLAFLEFFREHRNTSSAYFVLGLGLMISAWYRVSGRLRRGLVLAVCGLYLTAIALQHSRTGYLAAAVCLALWAGLALLRRLKSSRRLLRLGLPLLAVPAALILCYAAFDPLSEAIARAARPYAYDNAVLEQRETLYGTGSETTAEAGSVQDERELLRDAATLTGRTEIWLALLPAVREEPSLLLLGSPMGDEMRVINRYLSEPKPHMHNLLLEQLVVAGLPGFLCYALLLLFLLLRLIKRFFAISPESSSSASLSRDALLCGLCALMVHGLLSCTLSSTSLSSIGFCFLTGVIWSREP